MSLRPSAHVHLSAPGWYPYRKGLCIPCDGNISGAVACGHLSTSHSCPMPCLRYLPSQFACSPLPQSTPNVTPTVPSALSLFQELLDSGGSTATVRRGAAETRRSAGSRGNTAASEVPRSKIHQEATTICFSSAFHVRHGC